MSPGKHAAAGVPISGQTCGVSRRPVEAPQGWRPGGIADRIEASRPHDGAPAATGHSLR